jgi:hypothetical protein
VYCKSPPIARKTDVVLELNQSADCDTINNKKIHKKQYKSAIILAKEQGNTVSIYMKINRAFAD